MPFRRPLLLALVLPGTASAAEAFGDAVYYLGDLHAHTGYSGDAGSADLENCTGSCGDFADVFDTAKANGLDFLALTDHVNGGSAATPEGYEILTEAVLAANDPAGGFVTIPAAEVWFSIASPRQRLGHKTLLVFGDDATLADLTIEDMRIDETGLNESCEAIWDWMSTLDAGFGPAVLLPHHTAAYHPMPTDWSCHDPEWEPAVEVYSEHGTSMDESGYDPVGEGMVSSGTVMTALDPEGYALTFGFVGGTDSHDTRPGGVCDLDTEHPSHLYGGGLTVAVLDPTETFDRAAIHAAIVDRRTYATTGPMLPMAVTWSASGVELGTLGEALDAPVTLDLDVDVSVPADRSGLVTAVQVVGPDTTWDLADDGSGAWSGAVPAGEVPPWLFVAVQIDGEAWYAADGGCADGGDNVEWLWGSPSSITLWEDDTDGDGVSVLAGDCDDGDPAVNPEATETWYDGVDQDCDEADDWDQDGDGHSALAGGGDDCDDTSVEVSPDATDTWYDGIDADCDGHDDYDQDGDGYAAGLGGGPDCDDTSADVSPSAPETFYDGVDQDCDGASDWDADGDGYDTAAWGGSDCDDGDATISPGATEVWYDGVDQDCAGDRDDDADGDGFPLPLDCFEADPDRWACPSSDTHEAAAGCISVPGARVSVGALALAALLLRRRIRP